MTSGSGSVTFVVVLYLSLPDGNTDTKIENPIPSKPNSIDNSPVPMAIAVRDPNGSNTTDESNIASVVVTIVSGVGTLSTNPTGSTITIPNSGNGLYNFEVISTSSGEVVIQASVTTTSGETSVLPVAYSVLFENTSEASGGAIDITRQPTLTNINGLLSGALLDTQPVVQLLDEN